jgi:translation initiation factor 1
MNDFLREIEDELSNKITNKIHLRIQQRNARKRTTTIEGLENLNGVDINLLLKEMRKRFSCTGALLAPERTGVHERTGAPVIKLTGDQRENVKNYLVRMKIVEIDDIVIHG